MTEDPPESQGRPTAPEREPDVPAVTEDRVGVLAAYVRTNLDRFTDEALRASARKAGYSEPEIEAAWKAAADRSAQSTERQINVGVVIAVALAYVVLLYGGASVVASLGVGDIAAYLGIGIVIAGIAGWALLRDSRPSLASGLGWGVLLAVGLPLIIVLGILGICIVAGTTGTLFAPQ